MNVFSCLLDTVNEDAEVALARRLVDDGGGQIVDN